MEGRFFHMIACGFRYRKKWISFK